MSGLRAAIERLRQAMDDRTDAVEIIDTSGLAPWTRENWPPWRYPHLHPIPEAWGGKPDPKAEAGEAPDAE
jgi:hypothetical protein